MQLSENTIEYIQAYQNGQTDCSTKIRYRCGDYKQQIIERLKHAARHSNGEEQANDVDCVFGDPDAWPEPDLLWACDRANEEIPGCCGGGIRLDSSIDPWCLRFTEIHNPDTGDLYQSLMSSIERYSRSEQRYGR